MKLTLICMVLGLTLTNGAPGDISAVDFAKSSERFSGNFLNEVLLKNKDKNVILSAYSVLFPLAQLSMASVGDSRKELLSVIGLPENDAGVKRAFKDTAQSLENVKGVTLKMANKIFVTQAAELNEEFAKETKDVFKSEFERLNFLDNVAAAKTMNSWVESKTNNRIKDLVSPSSLDSDTRVVLVNAIYFKGQWATAFKPSQTKNRDFHVTKSKTIQVPMMHQKDDFKYGESEALNAQLLELPYEGKETSLLVILPKEIDGINALVEKLQDPKNLEEAVSAMRINEVDIYLPKFKIETTTNLKEVLQKMGIKKLFTSEASLTNLLKGNEKLYVDSAIQKAFIEVTEEGTEAAAANESVIKWKSGKMTFYVEFKAERPFLFVLRQGSTPLFSGVYQS